MSNGSTCTDDRRLLRRVVLRNYKSIAACDVSLAQLSFFVGRNGSGKSNFLDALRFTADALRFSIDHALRDRGGINGELERAVELAALRAGPHGGILILLDEDDDCPAELAPVLLRRAAETRPDRPVRVVLATAEYEAWFLAAAASIAGQRGVDDSTSPPPNPESIRDAKGWLSARMPRGHRYRPTLHQAAFSAIFDLDCARAAPSFDKMWRDVNSLLGHSDDA